MDLSFKEFKANHYKTIKNNVEQLLKDSSSYDMETFNNLVDDRA